MEKLGILCAQILSPVLLIRVCCELAKLGAQYLLSSSICITYFDRFFPDAWLLFW
jgi:hypothetical protein